MADNTEAPTTQDIESSMADMILGDDPVIEEQVEEPTDEPTEPVVEGDDEDPEVEASDEAPDEAVPEFVEVEFEGQLYEVPDHLKDALLRQQDYTTKTQEVAAQRKELEVQAGQLKHTDEKFRFAESIKPDIAKAQQLEQQAEQAHQYLRDNIDTLTSTDIEKIRLAVDDARRERDTLVESLKTKQTEFQQAQEQSYSELLTKGTEVLRQKIPGWGETQQKQVRDYALSTGFTEAEIGQVVDPRQVLSLWKAAQYDALKSGAIPAVKAVQNAPSIKPKGRDPMPKDTRAKLDLRKKMHSKSLSAKQKAEMLAEDLGKRWG